MEDDTRAGDGGEGNTRAGDGGRVTRGQEMGGG